MEQIPILEANPNYLLCIKPVGLDAEAQLPQALRQQLGGEVFPIHRLDKNVGGLMVFARNPKAAAAFSRAVQDGWVIKEYRTLVHGTPPEKATWEDLLWKDTRQNKVFVVKRTRKGVREARLSFERLTAGETSLVHVRLYTGRSHQIRVQFASRGFPLVGDHKYGARDDETAPRLWCCRITFPFGREIRSFEALPNW